MKIAKPFHIDIPEEEFEAIITTLRVISGPVSVQGLATTTGMNVNHLRYVIDELIKDGRLNKIVIDDRKNHKRYRYEVV
jgi:hypothetical protein